MTTSKLKTLIKVAAEIINIYLEQYDCNPTYPNFEISPFYDKDEQHSEVVNVHFCSWSLNNEFLEPLAEKLSKTQIKWDITRDEKQFEISLYF